MRKRLQILVVKTGFVNGSSLNVSANAQLGTCVLEVALCLTQLLFEAGEQTSYCVGESVMARRMDGDFGEGTVLDTLDDPTWEQVRELHERWKLVRTLSAVGRAYSAPTQSPQE